MTDREFVVVVITPTIPSATIKIPRGCGTSSLSKAQVMHGGLYVLVHNNPSALY